MSGSGHAGRRAWLILAAIVAIAAIARFAGLEFGLPHVQARPDEQTIAGKAVGFWATGDLNPHFFDYPSLDLYSVGALYGLYCLFGLVTGRFDSVAAFSASWPIHWAPFFLIGHGLARRAAPARGGASVLVPGCVLPGGRERLHRLRAVHAARGAVSVCHGRGGGGGPVAAPRARAAPAAGAGHRSAGRCRGLAVGGERAAVRPADAAARQPARGGGLGAVARAGRRDDLPGRKRLRPPATRGVAAVPLPRTPSLRRSAGSCSWIARGRTSLCIGGGRSTDVGAGLTRRSLGPPVAGPPAAGRQSPAGASGRQPARQVASRGSPVASPPTACPPRAPSAASAPCASRATPARGTSRRERPA